jgi:hypothetical protein
MQPCRSPNPELGPKLNRLGYSVVGTCGQELATFLKAQHEAYGNIIAKRASRASDR